jgi:hypothetical protein
MNKKNLVNKKKRWHHWVQETQNSKWRTISRDWLTENAVKQQYRSITSTNDEKSQPTTKYLPDNIDDNL